MSSIKGIVCTQCGATDIILIDESFAKCKVCGAHLNIQKEDKSESTIIIKHEGNKENKNEPLVSFFTVKENCEMKDFTRTAYVDLFTSELSDDICEAKFFPAKMEINHYILVTAEYEISYNASLGYDRVEKYLGKEKQRQSDGTYIEKLVEKERTVTDWRPTSGTYFGKNNAVYKLGERKFDKENILQVIEMEKLQKRFNQNILTNVDDNLEKLPTNTKVSAPFVISQRDLKNAYDWGAKMASEKCENNFSCDHVKGFSYTYKEKPLVVVGIVSNEFVLPYESQGKYSIESFSNKIVTTCDEPVEDVLEERRKKNEKKSKKSFWIPPISFFALLFLLIFVPVLSATRIADMAFAAGMLISGVPSVVLFFIWAGVHRKVWGEISEKEAIIIKHARDKKKYDCLEKLLKEKGFLPLTKEEIDRFKYLEQKEIKNKPIEKFVLWLENFSFKKK